MKIFILQLWVMFGVWILLDIILYSNSQEIFTRNMTCNVHLLIFLVCATGLAFSIIGWSGEMSEWILIFWLYLDRGGGVSNIPGWPNKNACENAGETVMKGYHRSRNREYYGDRYYVCVPRNV